MNMPDSIEVTGQPISLVFSDGGRAFFTERVTGNLWEVRGEENFKLVKHFPVLQAAGHHEAGLLGVALDPDFETNDQIYVYYTYGPDLDHAQNKVVRISSKRGAEEEIITGIPGGHIHNGGIIKFGPDGKLWVGVGVHNEVMEKAQDVNYLGGKVLRINADGSIPDDNPFKGSPVYSLGHRNIFGLAFHPKTGKLYVSDEGPEKDDEVNIVEPGKNYGWPKVTGVANDPKYVDPILTYTPTITPTQNVFIGDDLYFGSFNQGTVHRLKLSEDGTKVENDEIVYSGKPFGVIGIFTSPKGEVFVATPNRILKTDLEK